MGNYNCIQNDLAEPMWICFMSREASQYLNNTSDISKIISSCQIAGGFNTLKDILNNSGSCSSNGYSSSSIGFGGKSNGWSNNTSYSKNDYNSSNSSNGYNGYSNGYIGSSNGVNGGSNGSSDINKTLENNKRELKEALSYYHLLESGSSYTMASAHWDRVVHVVRNDGSRVVRNLEDVVVEKTSHDRTLYASSLMF